MIGSQNAHSLPEPETAHVAPRDGKRPGRDVDRVHARPRKGPRAGERDRARPRAHIEYAANAATRDPWRETRSDQLRDGRARHEHALVDIQLQTREERTVRQVSERHAPLDALLKQRVDERTAPRGQGFAVRGAAFLVRQPCRVEDQLGGFVARVVRAVPEMHAGARERARAALDGGAYRLGSLRLGRCMG